jgi:hypothetical protein
MRGCSPISFWRRFCTAPPFTWGGMSGVPEGEVRAAYLDALRAADRGDYGKLAGFVRRS